MPQHFDPRPQEDGGDIADVKQYRNGVKVYIETEIDGSTWTERFGFDHDQYPDGSWTEHVERAIQRSIDAGEFDDDPDRTTSA